MQIHAERDANFETELVLVLTQTSVVNIVSLVLFNFFSFKLSYSSDLMLEQTLKNCCF